MGRKKIQGLKDTLDIDLEKKGIEHRNRFIKLFMGRYLEFLPSLIIYDNIKEVAINQLKLEVGLRNNYNMVVGRAKNEKLMILGYTNSSDSIENPTNFFTSDTLKKDDINFIIARDLIPNTMKEISYYDNCETGNFIVLKNKTLNYISDYTILEHYTVELAEIVLSRFSLAMQSKINTFFIGQNNDETINELVVKLYNGSPFVKVNKYFDPKENIYTVDNVQLAQNFMELKREYQNKIAELNTMLGINSLAVEKESGVSDMEAKGNRGFKTSNSNIYIESRQNEIDKLNKRYDLNIKVRYNDEVSSQLQNLSKNDIEVGDENFNY